jgi:hypothetical protein
LVISKNLSKPLRGSGVSAVSTAGDGAVLMNDLRDRG